MSQLLIGKIVKDPSDFKILLNAFAELYLAPENIPHIGALMVLVHLSHICQLCSLGRRHLDIKICVDTSDLKMVYYIWDKI